MCQAAAVTATATNHRLKRMLSSRSVAMVCASERNFCSANSVAQLRSVGFNGAVHVVSPGGGKGFGQEAVPGYMSIEIIRVSTL